MMRFAGLATVFALTACSLPLSEENAVVERRRERAQRHGRLALAYLAHERPGIARQEAAMALMLAPGDPQALHAAALAELALGRLPAALPYLAAAATSVTARAGWRDDAQAGTILANYAAALCTAGRPAEARRWQARAAEAGRPVNAAQQTPARDVCQVDPDASMRD
ncbi:MAG: hypothetical protein ACRYHA_00895 [Janthinobacterium lividum]